MQATQSDRGAPAPQCAAAVLMVRPASFGWNPETAASNRFQAAAHDAAPDANARAVAEFDALAAALSSAGVTVHAFADRAEAACPDAVFPNNWLSLHADGTVVLYPMLAPNRRRERRLEFVLELERRGCRLERLVDLTHHELEGRCLEGTGSMVFDHAARVAYACLSPRTDAAVLGDLCAEIGYEPVAFEACDQLGVSIYHTNVMLSIGSAYALVCAEAVAQGQRGELLERLASGGLRVLEIDRGAMAAYSGNVLGRLGGDPRLEVVEELDRAAQVRDHDRAPHHQPDAHRLDDLLAARAGGARLDQVVLDAVVAAQDQRCDEAEQFLGLLRQRPVLAVGKGVHGVDALDHAVVLGEDAFVHARAVGGEILLELAHGHLLCDGVRRRSVPASRCRPPLLESAAGGPSCSNSASRPCSPTCSAR